MEYEPAVPVESLGNLLTQMMYVIGYQLAISPTNYEVDIIVENNNLTMTSRFDVSPKDSCAIPFCCLIPLCKRRKIIVDHFYLEESQNENESSESTLRLESTSAFCGLISCIEAGKIFKIIRYSQYLLLINSKEIFILSSDKKIPNVYDQTQMINLIVKLDPDLRPVKLSITF